MNNNYVACLGRFVCDSSACFLRIEGDIRHFGVDFGKWSDNSECFHSDHPLCSLYSKGHVDIVGGGHVVADALCCSWWDIVPHGSVSVPYYCVVRDLNDGVGLVVDVVEGFFLHLIVSAGWA